MSEVRLYYPEPQVENPVILTPQPRRSFLEKLGSFKDSVIYNPKIINCIATVGLIASVFALVGIDRNPTTDAFFRGHLVDAVGTAANAGFLNTLYDCGIMDPAKSYRDIGLKKLAENRPLLSSIGAIVGQFGFETLQGFHLLPGTFDLGDYGAYLIGALGWFGICKSAKFVDERFIQKTYLGTN